MKPPNAIWRPCKKRPPGRIKANIRRLYGRQDIFSFCVGHIGRKQPTRSVSHGIGGAAQHGTRIVVVVAITIVVDINEIGRRTGN